MGDGEAIDKIPDLITDLFQEDKNNKNDLYMTLDLYTDLLPQLQIRKDIGNDTAKAWRLKESYM